MRLVRVPLRISFVGGGSDIPSHYEKHGGAVVSVTINKYIYITAKECSDLYPHKYRLVYSQVEELNKRMDIKHPIINAVTKQYHIHSGLDLDVMSDIPAGTGMGSSSAFAVGLHQALNTGRTLGKHELAEAACNTEINELKEPIGKQDQYAAAFGGLNYFSFRREGVIVSPLSLHPNSLKQLRECLTLVYVGGVRSASKLLEKQASTDNALLLTEMAQESVELAHDLRSGKIHKLGDYLYRGWNHKKKLSKDITNPFIDKIVNTATAHGATGGKLLGAGGGGFVLLFHPIGAKYEMLEALLPLNLTYVPFEFDNEGCKVLYETPR